MVQVFMVPMLLRMNLWAALGWLLMKTGMRSHAGAWEREMTDGWIPACAGMACFWTERTLNP